MKTSSNKKPAGSNAIREVHPKSIHVCREPDIALNLRFLRDCHTGGAVAVTQVGQTQGSRANVVTLHEHGLNVLVLTSGDDRYLIRSAAKGGVLGVVLKSEPPAVALDAIREAAAGRPVVTIDWAAAIDSDPELHDVQLTDRQREVLALYASGEKAASVARRTNLSVETVNDYLGRIRRKYAEVGRPAPTKMDLYKRALEDGWLPLPRKRRTRSHDGG
ncbi:response regulator transcription factor [Hoyosella subflava]|uniref:Putative two-component system response regulator n=1 Tax=Hoyosella subflava (strain DSM 45089 / JCM 17490 / NBRC 109087 / DQS3-9A1) TaxID=443218 RepID=F6EJ70_HOYSD|nr:LuxR C-terminal-related transcriptional regulator [Hoyosella subflava]AEF41302.1 Putative two-component system response regulator [Hoyosella subflava DQS3-9A1]